MNTIKIELADEQAASLKAKAAEEGVTVEHWLRPLVEQETGGGKKRRYRLAELILQCDPTAALSNEDRAWL